MPTTLLYLIRHGATAANLERPYRLQGRGVDLPLSDLGRVQAERAASALVEAGVRPSAVFTSPLMRARETAHFFAETIGSGPVVVPDLIEADVGRWEGLTWDEAKALDPDTYERFHDRSGTTPYPGGESFAGVARRAGSALSRLATDRPGAVLVAVAHNVVNRAVLAGALGLPIDRARALRQSNGGINLIEFDDAGVPAVLTLNACLHLEGLETSGARPVPVGV